MVSTLHHLVQTMGDEDDADAVGLQAGDDLHQPLRLRQSEARGRLVHDDAARVERQRLDDLHQLALRQRQFGERRVRREIRTEAIDQRTHFGTQGLAIDQLQQSAMDRFATDEDVAGDVEIVEQVQLLMNERDAGRDRIRHAVARTCDAIDPDRPTARRDNTAEHTHQRRLAGAVLAEQRDHLAGRDRQADVVERDHARIGLADVDQLEEGLAHAGRRTTFSTSASSAP